MWFWPGAERPHSGGGCGGVKRDPHSCAKVSIKGNTSVADVLQRHLSLIHSKLSHMRSTSTQACIHPVVGYNTRKK